MTASSCATADNSLPGYNHLESRDVAKGLNCEDVNSHGATITFLATCEQPITIRQWCVDARGYPCGGTVILTFSNVVL